jgi:hypothetical protein
LSTPPRHPRRTRRSRAGRVRRGDQHRQHPLRRRFLVHFPRAELPERGQHHRTPVSAGRVDGRGLHHRRAVGIPRHRRRKRVGGTSLASPLWARTPPCWTRRTASGSAR